jgi:hypothetical protein
MRTMMRGSEDNDERKWGWEEVSQRERERESKSEPITTISFHFEAEDGQVGSQSLIKFTSRLQKKKLERWGEKHSARNQSINQSIKSTSTQKPRPPPLSLSLSLLWLAAGAHIQISKLLHWISVVKGRAWIFLLKKNFLKRFRYWELLRRLILFLN